MNRPGARSNREKHSKSRFLNCHRSQGSVLLRVPSGKVLPYHDAHEGPDGGEGAGGGGHTWWAPLIKAKKTRVGKRRPLGNTQGRIPRCCGWPHLPLSKSQCKNFNVRGVGNFRPRIKHRQKSAKNVRPPPQTGVLRRGCDDVRSIVDLARTCQGLPPPKRRLPSDRLPTFAWGCFESFLLGATATRPRCENPALKPPTPARPSLGSQNGTPPEEIRTTPPGTASPRLPNEKRRAPPPGR